MTTTNRRTSPLLLLPALLLLAPAFAQTGAPDTSGTATSTPSNAPSTVVVSGQRQGVNDPHQVNAAKDKILNGRAASSCAFMDPHNPKYDPIYSNYMSDFGLQNGISDDSDHFSDLAPAGDASSTVDSSGIPPVNANAATDIGAAPASGCGPADKRFAAGRNEIARKDKSLAFGYEAYDNKDYKRAVDQFTLAWNKVGYDEAGLMLARINLYGGAGVPKNTAKAREWLEKVANGRFDPQMDMLHFDPSQPRATTPKVDAAFMLARIYEKGMGVPADQKKADAWYAKAAGFGFVPALDILGDRDLAGAATKDPLKGVDYLKQAADAGYIPAQFHLARAYYVGDGVPRDLKMAGAYFDAAAHAGLPAAMFAAGRMYDLGEGVPVNQAKAIVYYKDAALKGDADAQFALGTYFYSGEVVGKNLVFARKWFDSAARQGQADAMFNLGVMTQNGEGGSKDPAVAYVWFSLARDAGHDGAAAAMQALAPKLSADERKRADAVLKPMLAKAH